MAPTLRRPVRWFTISVIEMKPGYFVATARCCFPKIKPRQVKASAASPRGALKVLRERMKIWSER